MSKQQRCPDMSECKMPVESDWFSRFCNKDYHKCFKYKQKRRIERLPREWLREFNEP